MNLADFFVHLGHILGVLSGNDPTVTTVTTEIYPKTSTPLIFDSTTYGKFSSESSSKDHSILLSTLLEGKTKIITGMTAESELPRTTGTDHASSETTVSGQTGSVTTGSTQKELSSTTVTGSSTHKTGSSDPETSTVTGSITTVTGSTETGPTGSVSTATGSESTVTGSESTVTGSGSTVTGSGSTVTGSGSTGTGDESSVVTGSGSTGTGTGSIGSESTVSDSGSTATGSDATSVGSDAPSSEPPTTEKPGLSKGAVAGIVIGCLLLVAVIASAIVFFMKNRSPEAQRLRI